MDATVLPRIHRRSDAHGLPTTCLHVFPVTADRRVVLDVAVHLTDGSRLSAHDFRLDIEGEAIADDVLSAYLIRDMRLLMAGRVDIANKRVVEATHTRGVIDGCTIAPGGAS
ncbi:hypothetical protein ACQQ2N_05960 [Dokdonella sp. MW10]|uniref:hypothetical protein n=1 Tax=Dokdonella sp. MW10 TaxID=2992926 RepID=UPI003F7DAAA0